MTTPEEIEAVARVIYECDGLDWSWRYAPDDAKERARREARFVLAYLAGLKVPAHAVLASEPVAELMGLLEIAIELHEFDARCFAPTPKGAAWVKSARNALSHFSRTCEESSQVGVDAAGPRDTSAIGQKADES